MTSRRAPDRLSERHFIGDVSISACHTASRSGKVRRTVYPSASLRPHRTQFVRRTRPKGAAVWFRTLSLVIAAALLGKAAIALAVPRRFYAVRERQYASESLPPKLLVAPAIVAALTFVAWYATIFHYQPWGWVVTTSLTALSCLAVDHVFRWQSHRQRMLKTVRSPKVSWVHRMKKRTFTSHRATPTSLKPLTTHEEINHCCGHERATDQHGRHHSV